MFWLLALVAMGTWVLYYRWQRRRIYKIVEEIPSGMRSYPVIGHAYLLKGDDEDLMTFFQNVGRNANKQGGLSTIWMANKLYVALTDPIFTDVIYKNCLDKDEMTMKFLRSVTGNGSIYAPVNIWRPRRKILAPIFSMRNLNQFVKVFSSQSVIMTQLLNQEAGAGDFSIWKYLTTYTFDSVCESSLGVKLHAQRQPDQPLLKAFDTLSQLLTERMCKPWLYSDVVYKSLPRYKEFLTERRLVYDFVDQLIRNKRTELELRGNVNKQPSADSFNSFLEMMIMQSGGNKGYTDLELREEVLVLLVAGTDISAVGAAFTVVMLSRYPEVQDRIFQELQDVFGNSERPVTVEDLPKLKYLEVVIKETLRLYTPVPVITREVRKDVKLPTGTTLVEGVSVLILIWALHRNPEYWGPDAEKFRPERFLEAPLKDPMQFQPFSYSNRNCLGYNYAMMSMKTVLSNLLRRYRVLPPTNLNPTKLKEPLRVKFDIMMKHVDDYYVRLEQRNYGSK